MGCDIHQINIMIDAETKKPYAIDGEVPYGECYTSNFIEEFIPGRNYMLFAVLAGVRGDEFQLEGNFVHKGIPPMLPFEINEDMNDSGYALHSFTWFYLSDLLKELPKTIKAIKEWMMNMSKEYPEFAEEAEEYTWVIRSIREWIEILKNTKKLLKAQKSPKDFNSSIIFFSFDS